MFLTLSAKKIIIAAVLLLLVGCYRHWPQAQAFADAVDCQASRAQVFTLAEQYGGDLFGEADAELLQFQQQADAVLIHFDSQDRIIRVAIFQADIKLLGTYRQLTSPQIVTDCQPHVLPPRAPDGDKPQVEF